MNPTIEQKLRKQVAEIVEYWDFAPQQDEDIRIERLEKQIQALIQQEVNRQKIELLDRLETDDAKLTDGRHLELDIPSWVQAERANLKEGV